MSPKDHNRTALNRTEIVTLRLREPEAELLRIAAAAAGTSVSELLRAAGLRRARSVLRPRRQPTYTPKGTRT